MTSLETAHKIDKDNNDENNNSGVPGRDPLTDIDYICKSTTLITESLRNGKDIAQLPNGDIIVTERKIVHLHYTWDQSKGKMVRIS
jgi:glucose/arabinose dehydrogenase